MLANLDAREMQRFVQLVRSPYFNKHEGVKKLIAYLQQVHPEYGTGHCALPVMTRQLFEGCEATARKQLGPIYSYSSRLLEEFLLQEQLASSESRRKLILLQALRTRSLDKVLEKKLEQMRSEARQVSDRDTGYYQYEFALATEADRLYVRKGSRRKDFNIELKQYFLDRYYLTEKLKDACELYMRCKIFDIDYADSLLPQLLKELRERPEEYATDPMIVTYYKVYLMLTTDDVAPYFDAWQTLLQNMHIFALNELKTIYNYFQNFCIKKINAGDQLFLQEIFKLYQLQLEKDLLLEDGYLSEWHYKNIATTGIRLGEMEWVKNFIDGFRSKLLPEKAENAYRFNLANYFYATRQYGEVLDLLIHIEYSDLRYSLGSKALLLRTYYDLEEYESLNALADSFRIYLLRNKLMANVRREGYQNLFRFTRKAAQIRSTYLVTSHSRARKELKKLQAAIARTENIFNETWLKEKVNELMGKVLPLGNTALLCLICVMVLFSVGCVFSLLLGQCHSRQAMANI